MQPASSSSLYEALRTAMDSARMAEILQRRWKYLQRPGLTLRDFQVARAHPRGTDEFVVEYRLHLLDEKGERIERAFAEVVGPSAADRHAALLETLGRVRKKLARNGQLEERAMCLPELGTFVRLSELDETLPGLELALHRETMRTIFAQCLSRKGRELKKVKAEVVSHRLGKRSVIRYRLWWFEPKTGRTKHRSVIGKLYRAKDERGKQVFETMQALWKNGFGDAGEDAIRVPRPLGYLDEWRLLLMEDFAGTPLESLEPAATAAAIPTAGRALAKLHRCHLEVEQRFTTEQEVDLLRGWVRVASLVEPSMKAGFGKALAEVEESLDRCREFEPALVHRDFYDKQVVLNDSEAAVIDFDTLCRSDPAIDLGNFLAHLRLAGLKGMGNVRPLKERFLAAYGAASPDLLVHAHAYTRSSLLRLACLHSLWPQWSHLAGPLLQEVP